MSKFAKTAIAAAMVMGAVVSSSAFAAGNNGTARFYGTIEDSPVLYRSRRSQTGSRYG